MGTKVVLMPFPASHSQQHIIATRGGNKVPETARSVLQLEQNLDTTKGYLRELKEEIATAESEETLKKARTHLDEGRDIKRLLQERLQAAVAARNRGLRPGWRGVQAHNVVCADSKNLVTVLRSLQNEDDVLYVRGHCDAGNTHMVSADQQLLISAVELAHLLSWGLEKRFPGKIKIFSCRSSRDEIINDSFAYQVADELSARGWTLVRVFGYSRSLSTFIENEDGYKSTSSGNQRAQNVREEISLERRPIKTRASCCVTM